MYISVFQRSFCCCIVLRKRIPKTLASFSTNEVIWTKIMQLKGERQFMKQTEKTVTCDVH